MAIGSVWSHYTDPDYYTNYYMKGLVDPVVCLRAIR